MPKDSDLAAKLAELEKKLITREKVEEIAAAQALDVLEVYKTDVVRAKEAAQELSKALEKRDFAKRVAASLDDRACTKALDKILVETFQDEVGRAIDEKMPEGVNARFEDAEFLEWLKSTLGIGEAQDDASARVDEVARNLAERLDKIQDEALPGIVERLLDQKLGAKIAERLSVDDLKPTIVEVAQGAVGEIANTDAFKKVLEDKFKVMIKYLTEEILPKQIRKILGK
jgi:hypothetical protein